MIKAFIFDLDGTLFDSTEANVRAYTKSFEAVGLTFDENKYRELFGLRYSEMIAAIAPSITPQQADEIRKLKPAFYKEAFDYIIPNTGLLALLHTVHATHKTALATTASHENVYNLLGHFSLATTSFDVIITGEQVKSGKPDPECYLNAISSLEVDAQECCVFEDSDVGVQAAVLSGAQVVRVRM